MDHKDRRGSTVPPSGTAGAPTPISKLRSPFGTATITQAARDAELVGLAVISEGTGWVAAEAVVPEGVPVLVFTKGLVERDGKIARVRGISGIPGTPRRPPRTIVRDVPAVLPAG